MMTNEELFKVLKEVQSKCSSANDNDCNNCPFRENEGIECVLNDPSQWNLDYCAIASSSDSKTNMLVDDLSAWHDGYDTGYKVGKNDTLLKIRDYVNEMRE